MVDFEQPFRYLTNEEFHALTRTEQLAYLGAAILRITKALPTRACLPASKSTYSGG